MFLDQWICRCKKEHFGNFRHIMLSIISLSWISDNAPAWSLLSQQNPWSDVLVHNESKICGCLHSRNQPGYCKSWRFGWRHSQYDRTTHQFGPPSRELLNGMSYQICRLTQWIQSRYCSIQMLITDCLEKKNRENIIHHHCTAQIGVITCPLVLFLFLVSRHSLGRNHLTSEGK